MRSPLLALLALTPLAAHAANPESTLLSPEAALAGAVIAADDDGGGGWYNPAALGGLKRSSVQLGISAYSYAWVNATGVLTTVLPWETLSQDTRTSRYSSVPSVLGLTWKLRDGLGFAVGLWTPFHDSFSTGFSTRSQGPLPSAPGLNASLDQRDDWFERKDDTWAVASIGWQVHPKLRLGFSLQGGLLTRESLIELDTTLTTDSPLASEHGAHIHVRVHDDTNRLSLRAAVGAQWLVSEHFRLGLGLRSPEVQVTRWGEHVEVVLVSALLPGFGAQEVSFIDTAPPVQGVMMVEQVRAMVGAVVDVGALSLRLDGEYSPALASAKLLPSVRVRLGALYAWNKDLTVGLGALYDSARTRASDGAISLDHYGLTGGLTYRADKVVKALGGGLWDLLGTVAVCGIYGAGQAPGMTIVPLNFSQSVLPVLPGLASQDFQQVPAWSLDVSVHFTTTVKF